ncbi:MAG: ADP-glyceromanno-heptose 6-epimerase [Bdellovibrionales bacterium]
MILVTGANGFIGSALVWELNQRGFRHIIAVDPVGLQERNLLRNKAYDRFLLKDEIWEFLKSSQANEVSWIFHMGACSSTTETNWDFLKENNLEYSQKLFDWCARNQKGLIYASSGATYGAGENGFDDDFDSEKLRPLNLYGDSKVMMDRWALQQDRVPPHWYGVKFFNVFGPNEYHKGSMASVVFKAFHQIRETGQLGLFKSYNPDYKDGEQKRDFVYVKDVVRWMVDLMDGKAKSGLYNMGFGTARTWLDLGRAVFKNLNQPVAIKWLEMPPELRNQYQYFTEAKMTKWQSQGLSEPQWPLEKAIEDYVRNYLNQKDPLL